MKDIVALLDRPETVVAVVGATDREEKFGSIIYRDLRAKGVHVRAVNPYRDSVAGDPCWRSLADLPEPPTIVSIVVPPTRTLAVLDECARLGFTTVWIQPGAADDAVWDRLERGDLDALVDACIMVPPVTHRPTAGQGGRVTGFDAYDPAFVGDPYPTYARLREEDPFYDEKWGAMQVFGALTSRFGTLSPAVAEPPRTASLVFRGVDRRPLRVGIGTAPGQPV